MLISQTHDLCRENRNLLKEAKMCGCFYCLETYSPKTILEWAKDKKGDSAICPLCSIDSVIPLKNEDKTQDEQLLLALQKTYFHHCFC